jgi:hypothetical protein
MLGEMIASTEAWWRLPGLLLACAVVLGLGVATGWWALSPPSPPIDKVTVLKVCRDGTLVLRREDGEFRVLRPGAWQSWHAASDKVCEP